MPRLHQMPDPADRSPNDPTVIMSSEQVLGVYNRENPDDEKERVVESVKNWTIDYAKSRGWNNVQFSGSQAILTAKVELVKPDHGS